MAEFTKEEFEQEIKTAISRALEVEEHGNEMDIDDIKEFCKEMRFALARTLKGLQSEKLRVIRKL